MLDQCLSSSLMFWMPNLDLCVCFWDTWEKRGKRIERNSERWGAMWMRRWRRWRQCSPLFHFLKMSCSLPQTSPFKSHFWAPASLLRQPVPPSFPSSPSLLMPRPPVLWRRWHSGPFSKRLQWLTRVEFAFFESAAVGRIRRIKGRPLSDLLGESEARRSRQPPSASVFQSLPRRPRSCSAVAHALLNPYPDSLGPNADLSFHRDSKHTSLFLSNAQTND